MGAFPASRAELIVEEAKEGIVSASGFQQIALPSMTLTAFDGSFFFTQAPSGVALAALTTPVLVEKEDASIVVPVGWQWRERDGWSMEKLLPIPDRFLREKLEALGVAEPIPPAPTPSVTVLPSPGFLKLPMAKQRAALREEEEILVRLRTCMAQDEAACVQSYASILPALSAEGKRSLSSLLPLIPDRSPSERLLLETLFSDPLLHLLLSLHPSYRTNATLMGASLPLRERELFLLALPLSDTEPRALPQVFVDAWRNDLRLFLQETESSDTFIQSLSAEPMPLIRSFVKNGRPERASRWKDAFETVLKESSLPEARKALYELSALELKADIDLSFDEDVNAVAPVSSASSIPYRSPSDVAEMARQILTDLGALRTIQTRIEPLDTQRARIIAIVFGDRIFDITIHIDDETVSAIELDGQEYPNTMNMHDFAAWVKNDVSE